MYHIHDIKHLSCLVKIKNQGFEKRSCSCGVNVCSVRGQSTNITPQ